MSAAQDGDPPLEHVRDALGSIVRLGPAALWGAETQPLREIRAVRRRTTGPSDATAPDVVHAILEEASDRVPSIQYRDLLRVVLGLDPNTRDLSARERRETAGRRFRGGVAPVAAGTVRQLHEPRALDELAAVLIHLEADDDEVDVRYPPIAQPLERELTCFVIGPIGNKLAASGTPDRETYEQALRVMGEVIEPACSALGLNPVRADTLGRAGEITDQIFRRLRDDDIVIADLTGANPNVMYELGLRHTRDKLTVQIGEFGRLPFDINTIRTIQFSSSALGLLNARDELRDVLDRGISGEFDPVSATTIWLGAGVATPDSQTAGLPDKDITVTDDPSEYFLEVLAEAEEQSENLVPALEAVGLAVVEIGELAERTVALTERSDAAGKGMRGRLAVITSYAASLDQLADRLAAAVSHYLDVLGPFAKGTDVLIAQMEADPDALEQGLDFGMMTRRSAQIARQTTSSFAGFVDTVEKNSKAARVLRQPSQRLAEALRQFVAETSVVDDWDRRLQALGIPLPPPDWTPEDDSTTPSGDVDDATDPSDEHV